MRAMAGFLVITGFVMTGFAPARERVSAAAQAPAPLRFEVVSIRENRTNERRVSRGFLPGGRVEISNMPLKMLIGFAYGIDTSTEGFRLSDRDASVTERRFDISALAPTNSSPTANDLVAMLKALLEDRFFLKFHMETRPIRVYALTMAQEGKLGSGLRPSKHSCREWAENPLETEPRDENGRGLCGVTQREVIPGGYRRRYAGTIARLAQILPVIAPELRDRLVVDMTGLSGNYQWEFTYAEDGLADPAIPGPPSILTAFPEQLGLKLEPKTVPIEVLIIDSVSLPSAN
ncbi:MAG TPA: TIGR03435 family protein [Gemmatimonadales bacterium]|nr:TIGR03435 family protein [Gemmatimonadales bacterium]